MNDELRAALDKLDAALAEARAAMVPQPQPETRGVVVQCGGRDIRLATIDEIGAGVCPGAGPRLYVKLGSCLSWTTTTLADIRAQAAEAGIELPPVTVSVDGYQLTAIKRADCHVCDNGSLLTDIIGVAEQYGEHTIHTSTLTPAQVCALCALAGWPKPQVRMVCTYTDGAPCEVDPENISGVGVARHATTIETNAPLADGSCVHHVREPVPVVQRMIDACKEITTPCQE